MASNETASRDSRFRAVARYADGIIKNVWKPPFSSRSKCSQFPQIDNPRRFASTFIRAERRSVGRLKKWCYSAARKKKKERGREAGGKPAKLYLRGPRKRLALMRLERNIQGTCSRVQAPLASSIRSGRSALWKIHSAPKREARKRERRGGAWMKILLTCFLCAWSTDLASCLPSLPAFGGPAETGRPSWLTNNKSRSSGAECAIDRRSLTRRPTLPLWLCEEFYDGLTKELRKRKGERQMEEREKREGKVGKSWTFGFIGILR